MKNILLTIGFDEHAQTLLDHAANLALAFSAKVWLVHVAAPDPEFVGYEAGPKYVRDMRAEELKNEHLQLKTFCQSLRDKKIDSEGLLIQGPTTELILKEATKLNADLIVMGHHKTGWLRHFLFGKTDFNIIDKSKIPVMVIPLD